MVGSKKHAAYNKGPQPELNRGHYIHMLYVLITDMEDTLICLPPLNLFDSNIQRLE